MSSSPLRRGLWPVLMVLALVAGCERGSQEAAPPAPPAAPQTQVRALSAEVCAEVVPSALAPGWKVAPVQASGKPRQRSVFEGVQGEWGLLVLQEASGAPREGFRALALLNGVDEVSLSHQTPLAARAVELRQLNRLELDVDGTGAARTSVTGLSQAPCAVVDARVEHRAGRGPTVVTRSFSWPAGAGRGVLWVESGSPRDLRGKVLLGGVEVAVSHGSFAPKAVVVSPLALNTVRVEVDGDDGAWVRVVVLEPDMLSPTVSMEQPTEGARLSSASVEVKGTAGAGAVGVRVGQVEATFSQGSYTAQVPLVEGSNALTAEARDRCGNVARVCRTVMLDSVPPRVVIHGVTQGQVSRAPLSPTWEVESTSPATVEAKLDGAPYVGGTPVSAEGAHVLVVVAKNEAGKETRVEVGFAIDTTPPRITLSGVEEGERRNTPVEVGFSVEEEHPGTVEAKVDGQPVNAGDTVSAEGGHELVVVATDSVGNQAEARRQFVVDLTPPVLEVLSPEPGSFTRAGSVEVVVSAVDDGPVAGVWLGGEALVLGADGKYRRTVVLEEGSNLLALVARDVAGNTSQSTLPVTRDSTPPQLSLTRPSEGAKVAGESVQVEGQVEDATPVTVRVAGQSVTVGPDGHFQHTVAVAQGPVSVEVVATDAAGNSANLARAFRVNTTPPRLDVTSPASGTVTEESTVTVEGFARSSDVTDTVKLELGGGEHLVAGDGRFSVEVPLVTGVNTVSIVAVDGYGLRTTRTVRVERLGPPDPGPTDGGTPTPDAGTPTDGGTPTPDGGAGEGPPVVVLASPLEGSLWGTERVAVLGRVEGGTLPVQVTVDGLPAAVTGRQFSAALALPEGSFVLSVRAVDALGRDTEVRRQVRVDQTAPFLEVTRPEQPTTVVTESPYLVEGQAGDAYLGGVTVNGAPALVLAGHFSAAVPLVPGDNPVEVVAVDLAGNRTQVLRTLRVNGMPPKLTVREPAEGSEATTPVVRVTMHVEASATLAEVRIGTGLATEVSAGEYTAQVPLALGENVIPLMARDTMGLTGTASVRVRYRDTRTEPLTVTGVDPAPQSEGLEPDTLVNVAFNKAVKPATVRNRFTVSAGGAALPGGWSVAPGGQTVSFIARDPLPESAVLEVKVAGVEPVEGPGMEGEFRSTFTVRRPLTRLQGQVLDEHQEPLAGVKVEVEGQGLSTRTGTDGSWALFGVAPGKAVLRYEGGAGTEGKAYPTVRRAFVVEAERDNPETRLVLVPVNAASAEPVDTAQPVHLTFGGEHGALALDIPAGGLLFADGRTREVVTATELPAMNRPVPTDGTFGPAWLWQLQPAGSRLMAPVELRLPNRGQAPPGHRAVLFTYDPDRHLMVATGLATVSADGTQFVSDEPVEAGSLEYFGYLPLPEETTAALARAPLAVPAFKQGFYGGLGFLGLLSIMPSGVVVWGHVRGPREQGVELTLDEPSVLDQSQPVTLDSAGSYRLTLKFHGATVGDLQADQREPMVATVSAVGPNGVVLAPPSDSPWRQESPGGTRVELSTQVELKPGITHITLSAGTPRGRDVLRLGAELAMDDDTQADGGGSWKLRVRRTSSQTPEELEGQGVVRFSGMPVIIEATWGSGGAISGPAGKYAAGVMDMKSLFLPPSFVRACVNLPAWSRVQAWTDASGKVQTRLFRNAQLQECSVLGEMYYAPEMFGPLNVHIDVRYLFGNLTFVDRQGQPLPPACDESERDPETGQVLSLSADDVRTTEVHFFLEHDPSQPIATYTVAHPYECGETPPSGAQARYARMRMGPSGLRWLGQTVPDSVKRNKLRLVPGDQLVVFAINHATGYSGMSTVTVPPITRSTRGEDGSCPADDAAGGPIIVNEWGESVPLSRCTLSELGIPSNLKLYPPEIDVRVERRARAEGVKEDMETSLVRHGGASTTRDEFVKVSTHWRVRREPAEPWQPKTLPPADSQCDGGVKSDGGFCAPQVLYDEGQQGRLLERYCAEFQPPLTEEQQQHCLQDDSKLRDVPAGVPPLAGRVVRITGSAAEEPAVASFKIAPGRASSTVQTAMRVVDGSGATVTLNNLPRANYYVQVVGQMVLPRDRDQDGVIQPSEENSPPPDFSDGEDLPGLPNHAVHLKNVYRSLEGDGGYKVERYDLAREHEFRVLEVGAAEVVARTDRGEERPLPGPGQPPSNSAASPEDVAYQFLLHLLEPEDDGRAETLSGQYALRLGSDSFGIECPIEIDEAAGKLRGTCEGDYLPEVLSASDIVYLEIYLRGNAENVLYRFNFDGLSMREDYLGVASLFTSERAVEEREGRAVEDRPVSLPNEAHFFVGPHDFPSGRLRVCTTEDCSGDGSLIKDVSLRWQAGGAYSVEEAEGGSATAKLIQEEQSGAGGARHFRLALPATLTRMPGESELEAPRQIFLVKDPGTPNGERSAERLGSPKGRFQGLSAQAPGQQSVAGINVADLHLSFTHTDFSVPQYAEVVAFSRTYVNQNDLPSALGVGWRHGHDGFVVEEQLGRYVVILGSQAWSFLRCAEVNRQARTARECQTDKTHGMALEVDGQGVKVTTEYGHVYRFDQPAVRRDKEGRRKWLLTKFHDGRGRGEEEGWTHLTYAENTNRLTKVERTPGVLSLEFKYCEEFSDEDCKGIPDDAAGTLKALARSEGFKLLKGVILKNNGAELHVVRFKHDSSGNLLEAERATDPPPQRWKYTYDEVPDGLAGRIAWRAVNELSEARFEVDGQTQWLATYSRGGAECYEHLEPFECVTEVKQTGFMGEPLKVQGLPSERSVSLPDGAQARVGLNDFGNTTTSTLGSLPARTMTWPSSQRGGEVRLETSTSPGGQTLKYLSDGRMRMEGVKLEGASAVPGLGSGELVTVTSRNEHGLPVAGTIASATGPASWSMPRSPSGDAQGLTVSSSGGPVSLFSRTMDAEGRTATETDALGNTITWTFGGTLELPTSASVSAPGSSLTGLSSYNLTMEYDAFGRLTLRRNEATGATETWSYNGQGHVLEHTRSGEPSEIWAYSYSYGNQQVTLTEELQGVFTRTALIKEGLLTQETISYGQGTASRTYAYERGLLKQKTDERGVTWAYEYDDVGRLEAITANGKPSESYELDADGNVKVLTDREGRTIQIGYDSLGQPISWLYEDGHLEQVKRDAHGAIVWQQSASPGAASSHSFDQEVDALGRVLAARSAGGSAGGVEVQATYDAAGRLLTRVDQKLGLSESFAYADALGRLTRYSRTVKSGNGELAWEETRQYSDSSGRTEVQIQRTIGTGNGQRTENLTQVFDALGRLLSEERPGAGKTEYTYNARGNALTATHSVLGTTTYTYNGLGHLLSKAEPGGVLTTYTTDAAGLVLTQHGPHEQEQWTFTYDDFGRQKSRQLAGAGSTPAAGWSFVYQGAGRVEETNPIGAVITRVFNSRQLLLSEHQGTRTTEYAYDGMWLRLRKVTEGGWQLNHLREFDDLGRELIEEESWEQGDRSYSYRTATAWNGLGATRSEVWQSAGASTQTITSTVQMDSLGNVVSISKGGLQDAWTYDASGVLAREALAGRPEKRFLYEQDRLVRMEYGAEATRYTYDGAGRLESETDPSNRVRTLEYDAQGMLKLERFGSGTETLTTGYTYDRGGFLKGMTRGGAQWSFTHGPRGELQAADLPGGLGSYVYQHDALLRVVGITPPPGGSAAQTFAYDEFGRGTRRTRGSSVWVTTWLGGASTTNDPNGDTVVRVYDARGRVAREQYQPGGPSQPHTDLTAVAYAHNGLDQLLAAHETRNSGSISNVYGYDGRSRLVSIQRDGVGPVTYSYTDSGQKESVTSPTGTVTYTYDGQDRVKQLISSQGPSVTVEWEPGGLLSELSGNGVVEKYAWYGHGLMRSITSTHNGSPLMRYEYSYDARGNRLEERYTGPGATAAEVTQYGYDVADRMTGVRYPTGEAELYGLGADGSRREEKQVAGYLGSLGPEGLASAANPTRHWRYAYDTAGGLQRIEDVLTAGVEATITTDAGGRVVTEARGGTTRQYGWEAAGHLASIQQLDPDEPLEATYRYGFDGLRRVRSEGGAETRYVWGADGELLEEGPAAGAALLYARAHFGVAAVGGERLLHDALGSIVGRVGTSTHVSRYGAWGALHQGQEPGAPQPGPGYAGQHRDAFAGLHYAQQRWYDSRAGRFLSEDPVPGLLSAPASLHAWSYAQANPARFVDPRGTFFIQYQLWAQSKEERKEFVQRLDDLQADVDSVIQSSADYWYEKGGPIAGTIVYTGGKFLSGVPFGILRTAADPVDAVKGTVTQLGDLKECGRAAEDVYEAGAKCAGAVGTAASLAAGGLALRRGGNRSSGGNPADAPAPDVQPQVQPPPQIIKSPEPRGQVPPPRPSRPSPRSEESGWLGGASNAPEARSGWLGGGGSRRTSTPARGWTPPTVLPAYKPPKGGRTIDNTIGSRTHADRAAKDRASGQFDDIDQPMAKDGVNILVPARVDLKTGAQIGSKLKKAKPDGVSYSRGEIMDYKPAGSGMHKQQMIQYITAYERKMGTLPTRIEIRRYNKVTGDIVDVNHYNPLDFMPWRQP